jgi:hypothetical protein
MARRERSGDMMDGKAGEPRLRATGRLLNAVTVAIYVLAATQAFRSVLPDAPPQLSQIMASLTAR